MNTPPSTPSTNTTTTLTATQTMSAREARNLLVTKLGMKESRTPFFSDAQTSTSNGTIVATVYQRHNDRVIRVKDTKAQTERQYLNLGDFAIIEELGDLHFSPDGTKLAYSLYAFNSARNDEVVTEGMGYVYVLDLRTGTHSLVRSSKDTDQILRVTAWNQELPTITTETIRPEQRPGEIPHIYIPYTLTNVTLP